ALRATVTNQAPIEPLIANKKKALCLADTVGVDNTGPSIYGIAGVDAARARTSNDNTKAPADQLPTANATVTNARITDSGGTPLIELPGTIASQVTASCQGTTPVLTATSTTLPLKIGGQTIATDKPVTQILSGVGQLTGAILTINPGEEVRTATSLTRRGLHVNLHLGSQVIDLVLAEATVTLSGNPCTNHGTT